MPGIDIAMNIFAKPWRTALSLLSLTDKCKAHIDTIWLQYEPVGSKYDTLNPYLIVRYLTEQGFTIQCSQPDRWLAREAATKEFLEDSERRSCIRYEHAFENSTAPFLFLVHNDVFILRDLLGALRDNIGQAFAIGKLGQCWNCPASHESITRKVLNRERCTPEAYLEFKPTAGQLNMLYKEAAAQNIFKRPYDEDNFKGEFSDKPWPLPECRINEWACLINMNLVKNLCIPHGSAWTPGAYRLCAGHNLDIGVAFFRDLHARGLVAKNFDIDPYMKHWVGTGKNTPIRHVKAEDNARRIIEKHYPKFMAWLKDNELTRPS